jgi:hypothetical protein
MNELVVGSRFKLPALKAAMPVAQISKLRFVKADQSKTAVPNHPFARCERRAGLRDLIIWAVVKLVRRRLGLAKK